MRAVRKIVSSKPAHEELVKKGSLIRSASGGVEFGLIWTLQRPKLASYQSEGLVPRDRHVMVGSSIIAHGLGETPLLLEPIVTVLLEFANGMSWEEVPRHSAACQLEGHRLGAILTEFKGARVLRVRPRASGAVEPVRLVHREQRLAALEENALFPQ